MVHEGRLKGIISELSNDGESHRESYVAYDLPEVRELYFVQLALCGLSRASLGKKIEVASWYGLAHAKTVRLGFT